jgi:dephospho-CoA kinase
MKVGGRGTTYCPYCQKSPQKPIKIGIFGKSGSGKSTVLEEFNKLGYTTISADKIVHDLYLKDEVKDLIIKQFNLNKNEDFISSLRSYLSSHKDDIKKINKIIHPLVRKQINKEMNEDTKELVFAEVPLLFEAGMEYDFDFLIAIDVNEEIQLERLLKRNRATALDIKKINSYSKFEKNKEKADFVINNNHGLSNLKSQIKQIINKLRSLQD